MRAGRYPNRQRYLKPAPFRMPRSFTGSTSSPRTQSYVALVTVTPSGTDMRTGQASSAFQMYVLHPNDMWRPWVTLPDGDGTFSLINEASDVQTPINGLELAGASSTAGGWTKGAVTAFQVDMYIEPSPHGSWSNTATTSGTGGSADQQVVNSQDFYVWATCQTHTNEAGHTVIVDDSMTLAEIKAMPNVTMWKIDVGSGSKVRKCTIRVPSVQKFLKSGWKGTGLIEEQAADFTGNELTLEAIMAVLSTQAPLRNKLAVDLATKEFLDVDNDYVAPNVLQVRMGIWAPNIAAGSKAHLAFSTNVVLTQRVQFYEAKQPAVGITTIPA